MKCSNCDTNYDLAGMCPDGDELKDPWVQKHMCTCNSFLCSLRCQFEHTGGYSIDEIREMEGEETKI